MITKEMKQQIIKGDNSQQGMQALSPFLFFSG